MKTPDIIFVGAGVAALGAAWRLQQQGHQVLVLEMGEVGSGTSGRAGGMLAPSAEAKFGEEDLLEFELRSMELWPSFVEELESASNLKIDYRTQGTLIVAVDRDDFERIEHQWTYHKELGLDVERLDGDELRKLEPGLAPGIPGGLRVPGDHQVCPMLLVEGLAAALRAAGGEILTNHRVQELLHDGQRVLGVKLGDKIINAPQVVLAPGVWGKQILGIPPEDMPKIRPIRGQMIAVDLGSPPLLNHVVRGPDAYLIPRSDGELVIGSTMEEKGLDDHLTAGGMMDILVGAWEVLPGIHNQNILGTWTGFRPMTLSNFPEIRKGALDGLFWSVGHGRNGILLTPATAERLVGVIQAFSAVR